MFMSVGRGAGHYAQPFRNLLPDTGTISILNDPAWASAKLYCRVRTIIITWKPKRVDNDPHKEPGRFSSGARWCYLSTLLRQPMPRKHSDGERKRPFSATLRGSTAQRPKQAPSILFTSRQRITSLLFHVTLPASPRSRELLVSGHKPMRR